MSLAAIQKGAGAESAWEQTCHAPLSGGDPDGHHKSGRVRIAAGHRRQANIGFTDGRRTKPPTTRTWSCSRTRTIEQLERRRSEVHLPRFDGVRPRDRNNGSDVDADRRTELVGAD